MSHEPSLPATPVLDILRARGYDNLGHMARVLNVSESTINRWASGEGGIGYSEADRIAVLLGYHPAELWEGWHHIYLDPQPLLDAVPGESNGAKARSLGVTTTTVSRWIEKGYMRRSTAEEMVGRINKTVEDVWELT